MKKAKKSGAVDFTFLFKTYPGKWVALSGDEKKVLGFGMKAKDVLKNARKGRTEEPILYRVPSKITFSISIGI